MEILSITTNLSRYGGAQKVLLDVHRGLKERFDCKILGFQKYEKLHSKYEIEQNEYVEFKNPLFLQNKIVLVHARNVISIIVALKRTFFLNTQVIYVSHNVYSNYRRVTFLPENIVSISKRVTSNLVDFFSVDQDRITLIYNGIKPSGTIMMNHQLATKQKIKVLYPARVNSVKRQLEIVRKLSGKLSPDVEILFAGTGPDFASLTEICSEQSNFKALGFVEDIEGLIKTVDFVMLFSTQEGLPISLLEGIMHGKPLLVNDVGGNLEIGVPGINAVLLIEDWDDLANKLNGLLKISPAKYHEMSKNSLEIFNRKFHFDQMISKYEELIEKVKVNFLKDREQALG